ncbi:MAG: hypothetical protein HPY65_00715 [Syntrophaceae bacterium]|nr:hypothetical protein [Syntrophaceae bacterium]
MITKLLQAMSIPIIILNMVGGFIGGIWLAFLGEWKLIGIGLLLLFTSHWIISILLMPTIPIGLLSFHFLKKKNILGHFFGFLSILYTNFLIIGSCYVAFLICTSFYTEATINYKLIPYMLWSWGMALGPWQYLSSKETHNEISTITLFSASVFYFFILVTILIIPAIAFIPILLFCLIHFIVIPIVSLYIAHKTMPDYVDEFCETTQNT